MKPLNVSKKGVLAGLVAVDAGFIVAYVISVLYVMGRSYSLAHWFDLDDEGTIPAWYSSAQLLTIFLLCWFHSRQVEDRKLGRFYFLTGAVFLFFSADETAAIHETLNHLLKKYSAIHALPNLDGTWMFAYLAVLLIVGFSFLKDALAFLAEKSGRTLFILGALVFIAGGAGLELISYFVFFIRSTNSLGYFIEVCGEEFLEMLGESLMIYAMMLKIDSVQAVFEPDSDGS